MYNYAEFLVTNIDLGSTKRPMQFSVIILLAGINKMSV